MATIHTGRSPVDIELDVAALCEGFAREAREAAKRETLPPMRRMLLQEAERWDKEAAAAFAKALAADNF